MAKAGEAARDLLAEYDTEYGIDEVPPVPVTAIAKDLLLLDVVDIDDIRTLASAPTDGGPISGMLTTVDKTIWVDRREADRSPARRRFTIAHELGHWMLHAKRGEKGNYQRFCRGPDLDSHAETGKQEREANDFAAELLMPEEVIAAVAPECGFNLALLATRFEVSVPALELRLMKLKLLPVWMRS